VGFALRVLVRGWRRGRERTAEFLGGWPFPFSTAGWNNVVPVAEGSSVTKGRLRSVRRSSAGVPPRAWTLLGSQRDAVRARPRGLLAWSWVTGEEGTRRGEARISSGRRASPCGRRAEEDAFAVARAERDSRGAGHVPALGREGGGAGARATRCAGRPESCGRGNACRRPSQARTEA